MKLLWEYSVEELAERCAIAENELERLRASLHRIGRRSAPSTRTWDGMIADMGWINDETRRVLETEPEQKTDETS